jgi:energy-coupling factor transporter transmembrane protein EcfT
MPLRDLFSIKKFMSLIFFFLLLIKETTKEIISKNAFKYLIAYGQVSQIKSYLHKNTHRI